MLALLMPARNIQLLHEPLKHGSCTKRSAFASSAATAEVCANSSELEKAPKSHSRIRRITPEAPPAFARSSGVAPAHHADALD
jgi:hypothetical protein